VTSRIPGASGWADTRPALASRASEAELPASTTVCTRVTADFLEFSASVGNDLSTPHPEFGFAGLQPGDQWCLCAPRWQEAFEAGVAPPVVLASTHAATLEWVQLGDLVAHAI